MLTVRNVEKEDECIAGYYVYRYVANLTLDSLAEMFTGAKLIMDWLATCAQLVAKEVGSVPARSCACLSEAS